MLGDCCQSAGQIRNGLIRFGCHLMHIARQPNLIIENNSPQLNTRFGGVMNFSTFSMFIWLEWLWPNCLIINISN